MPKAIKDGIKTTEFFLSVLVLACATILVLTDDVSEDTWKWVVSIVTAGYALSRGLVKRN